MECDTDWAWICYRGAVNAAIKGKRGQSLLKEVAAAMDAMPVKRLIASELECNGEFCTLGVVGHARGLDMSDIDPEEYCQVADKFNIAKSLAREIVYMNDEASLRLESPEERWKRMRAWLNQQILS